MEFDYEDKGGWGTWLSVESEETDNGDLVFYVSFMEFKGEQNTYQISKDAAKKLSMYLQLLGA